MNTPADNQPSGWYPDPTQPGLIRYWDGTTWTDHTQPAPPTVAVTAVPVQTNHTFHLLMTVFTCGLWGIVWLIVWALNQNKTKNQYTRT